MKKAFIKKTALFAAVLLLVSVLTPLSALADPKATAPAFLLGDVDMDGGVSSSDARLALRAAVGLEQYDKYSYSASAADADRDNEISSADARLILRNAVGLEPLETGIRESCGSFAVTLPESWEGKYVTEKTETSISFYHKVARELDYGGFLFRIMVMTVQEAKESYYYGELVCMLEGTDPAQCVVIRYPSDMPAPLDLIGEYNKMAGSSYLIAGTLESTAWYVYPVIPDCSSLNGSYYGTQGADMPFSLDVTEIRRNSIDAVISYDDGEGGYDELEVLITMFGNEGVISWLYGYETIFGSVEILEDGSLEVDLNGKPGTWMYSDIPITFFPRGNDGFNGDPMTASYESEVWEKLRGIWVGTSDRTVLLLTQDSPYSKDVSVGPIASEAYFSGLIEEPFFVSPSGMVRLSAYSPAYEDVDGIIHPRIDVFIYLDIDELDDGRIRWSFDRDEWTTCYFFSKNLNDLNELSAPDPYQEELSRDDQRMVLQALKGIWANDERHYILRFMEDSVDSWEVAFGAPESEFDYYGYINGPICGDARGSVRITAASIAYTDIDGDYHPSVEVNVYIDLSRLEDGRISWGTDPQEWMSCRLYSANPYDPVYL